jgi:hypothetical protein
MMTHPQAWAPDAQPRLTIVPLTFRQACDFVELHHRHNPPPTGAKFCIGVCDPTGRLRGVLMAGRPVARSYDDGLTIEVNRSATDGCPNANSALYGAAWRVASAMGYRRLITYTQADESGSSMRAVGARQVRDLPARKGWAESSVALRAMRDPVGTGGVERTLWALGDPLANEAVS